MNWLRNARRANKLTMDQVAKRLGISTSGYKKLEYGTNKFTLARFIQICKVLDLDAAATLMEVISNEYIN